MPIATRMRSPELTDQERSLMAGLEARLGRTHVRQRLGIEHDHELGALRGEKPFFTQERWYCAHGIIRAGLALAGLLPRARRNALRIEVQRHEIDLPRLPAAFDGFTLLHLSDLHLDINERFLPALVERIAHLDYDLCVLSGDYRTRTFGRFDAVEAGMAALRPHIRADAYAVLGNHDTLRLVPGMEAAGYRLLINEWAAIERAGARLCLAGIDDAHFYRLDDLQRARAGMPDDGASILLSHTPETYRHAAHAGFDLMLSGHTHGGQICLPGGVPLLTTGLPRRICRGLWRYNDLVGYTSAGAGTCLVDVRLNCPPEVALLRLRRRGTAAPGPPTPRTAVGATRHDRAAGAPRHVGEAEAVR